jgi:enoyl-CoA hydratase/carnithine racemase
MAEFVSVERSDDGVAVLRLDRPPANALSTAVLDEIAQAARDLTTDPPGAVVVTGGDKIFAAGADISEFGGPDEAAKIAGHFREAFDAVAGIPRMTIAAVAGYALGGGCELALACDMRVVADSAIFGQPEVLLGIIPGAGGTQRLTRLVGPARAKDIILSGRRIKANEALNIGLCDRIFPAEVLQAEARAVAMSFGTGAVAAHALAKRAIDAAFDASLPDGLDVERDLFVEVFETEDAKTGVQSFLEHGPGRATFKGR